MRLTFVGHAGLLVEHGGTAVLCDPWLEGDAFNGAWAPWPAPRLAPEALERVTHLWVSHEHPDHLSIPTLRSIPADRRASITALYQRHWSGEVARFLGTLGFADVVELDSGAAHGIGRGVDVVLHQVGHEDASLAIRGGGRTVLDLNDCKPSDAKLARMRRDVGPIDVLVDQFSLAGWAGNPEDVDRHGAAAAAVLEGLVHHVRVLEPRWVLPAASFVRFVTPENVHLNAVANPVAAVVDRLGPTRTAVLRPGDEWDLDGAWSGTPAALAAYAADPPLPPGGLRSHGPVPVDEVVTAVEGGLAALRQAHPVRALARLAPVTFVLAEDGARLQVVPGGGVRRLEPGEPPGPCVVEAPAQAVAYAFTHRWGLTTLAISGGMRLDGDERPFTRLKQVAAATAAGFRTRSLAVEAVRPRGRRYLARRWRDLLPELVGRAA